MDGIFWNNLDFSFFLHSDVGSTSAVECSTSLTNWNFFTNIVNSNSRVEFTDGATNPPYRFYRAKKLS